jgi:hypothetical protein
MTVTSTDSKELTEDPDQEDLGEKSHAVDSLAMDILRVFMGIVENSSKHTSGLLTDLRSIRCSGSLKCKKVFFEETM